MREMLVRFGLFWARMLGRLPFETRRRLGGFLGSLLYFLAAPRRRIAQANLGLCFPAWSAAEVNRVSRAHFRAYASAFLDRFELFDCSSERLRARVSLVGLECLERLGEERIIILAPHFLGLDAGGVRIQLERQIVSLYSDQSSPRLNAWILQGRSRFNEPILISRREGIGRLARLVKKGKTAYFLPDMDFGERDAVFASFFGQPAATVTSVVRLAQMTGAHILPMVTRLTETGYESRFYPAWSHEPSDSLEEGVQKMNAFIEARVLEDPAQYLWTHRRFKTRPLGHAPVYDRR
ncbi:MAG: Lipid biosynthesis lauroyl acyltransferase [Pseudomonadota bacterium]